MRADRLLKLADYLETVPRDRFEMRSWDLSRIAPAGTELFTGCGFAGCAIGWAIHAKLFPELVWSSGDGRHYPVLDGTGYGGFRAIGSAFGISESDADDKLFGASLAGTPKQVAKRIRKFVRDRSLSTGNAT